MAVWLFRRLRPLFFTAGARGLRDRRNDHPRVAAMVRVRRYGDPAGGEWTSMPLFGRTIIADTEGRVNRAIGRRAPKRLRLAAKAERIALQIGRVRRWQRAFARSGRDELRPARVLTGWRYLAIILPLAAGEYSFNFASFNRWFPRFDSLWTFISGGFALPLAALVPSIVLPLSGHFLGRAARHARSAGITRADALIALIAAGSSVGVFWMLAQLRLLTLAVKDRPPPAPEMFWGLFTLNAVVLVASVIASYLSHGDDSAHDQSHHQAQRLEKLEQEWVAVAGPHDALRETEIRDVEELQQGGLSLISEYCDFNLMAAADATSLLPDGIDLHIFIPRDHGCPLGLAPPSLTEQHEEGANQGWASAAYGAQLPNGRDPAGPDVPDAVSAQLAPNGLYPPQPPETRHDHH